MKFSTNLPIDKLTDAQLMKWLCDNQAASKAVQARIAEIKAELFNRIVAIEGSSISTDMGTATFVPASKFPKWNDKVLDELLSAHPAIDEARGEGERKAHVRFKAKKAKEGAA